MEDLVRNTGGNPLVPLSGDNDGELRRISEIPAEHARVDA
jgi:hypothetical protein